MSEEFLTCYNCGCGLKFDPIDNKEDSCTFHPGAPYFHDAYKGWSCCKKKCTDFTEFLNIKGCATSFHNPVKPAEPEKPVIDKSQVDEVIEYRAPEPERMERPPYETPQILVQCEIAPALAKEAQTLKKSSTTELADAFSYFTPPSEGTLCKNNACKKAYEGPQTDSTECLHHPGVPIFHEGSKFWTCCKKRTFEFETFLNQPGCTTGKHNWTKRKESGSQVKCRYDWHQTGSHVVVAVYAKKYDPSASSVNLSPVRLTLALYFPEQGGSFNLDLELHGVVDVTRSSASMLSTKLEVKMRKAEPGSWSKLFFPRDGPAVEAPTIEEEEDEKLKKDLGAVDLSDL